MTRTGPCGSPCPHPHGGIHPGKRTPAAGRKQVQQMNWWVCRPDRPPSPPPPPFLAPRACAPVPRNFYADAVGDVKDDAAEPGLHHLWRQRT